MFTKFAEKMQDPAYTKLLWDRCVEKMSDAEQEVLARAIGVAVFEVMKMIVESEQPETH